VCICSPVCVCVCDREAERQRIRRCQEINSILAKFPHEFSGPPTSERSDFLPSPYHHHHVVRRMLFSTRCLFFSHSARTNIIIAPRFRRARRLVEGERTQLLPRPWRTERILCSLLITVTPFPSDRTSGPIHNLLRKETISSNTPAAAGNDRDFCYIRHRDTKLVHIVEGVAVVTCCCCCCCC